jgi:hypothetical protein
VTCVLSSVAGARSSSVVDEGGEATPEVARASRDDFDPVIDEIERWARLPREHYASFYDEDEQLINEFEMMWALRERFPLHFFVFKQVASHLAHEANVEQVFSRAGGLSNALIDPLFLAALVMASANKKAYCPLVKAIRDKYYELFRGKGRTGSSSSGQYENDDVEASAAAEAEEADDLE